MENLGLRVGVVGTDIKVYLQSRSIRVTRLIIACIWSIFQNVHFLFYAS